MLYDVTHVLEGRITLIGQFIGAPRQGDPDFGNLHLASNATKMMGPCVMSLDGNSVCCVVRDVKGVVFLKPCRSLTSDDEKLALEESRKVFNSTYGSCPQNSGFRPGSMSKETQSIDDDDAIYSRAVFEMTQEVFNSITMIQSVGEHFFGNLKIEDAS